MNTFEAISQRRSIRKFSDKQVPRDLIEKILAAAVLAPSGKNRQPWRFVVLKGKKKTEFIALLKSTANVCRFEGTNTGSFRQSITVMDKAPVLIIVLNAYLDTCIENGKLNHNRWLTDVQSIGAAIQNILLRAHELGLGTLWICDILYAEKEIRTWLDTQLQLIAAISLGYADERPLPRPRKPWQEVTDIGI